MAHWSNLCGSIIIHKSKHISVKKLVEEVFDDVIINKIDGDYDGDCYIYELDIDYEEEGDYAIAMYKEFERTLLSANAKYDLDLTVRMVN